MVSRIIHSFIFASEIYWPSVSNWTVWQDFNHCTTILGFLRSGLLDHIVNFNAFGKQQQIKLKVNRKLLSKTAQMFLTNGVDEKTQLSLPADTDCHYLHNSEEMSAALSNCGKGKNSAYNLARKERKNSND